MAAEVTCSLESLYFVCNDTDGDIFFELDGVRYESGSTVIITEVGSSTTSTTLLDPALSLVCMTEEVNTQCCRGRDGGNVGEWVFPDGTTVPRRRNSLNENFVRSGFTHQVRLNRRNGALGPTGNYTCTVSPQEGCGDTPHVATISLGQ